MDLAPYKQTAISAAYKAADILRSRFGNISRIRKNISKTVRILFRTGIQPARDQAGMGRIASRHQHSAVGCAERAGGQSIFKGHTLSSKPVDVGRRYIFSAVCPTNVGAQLVGENKDHVWPFREARFAQLTTRQQGSSSSTCHGS